MSSSSSKIATLATITPKVDYHNTERLSYDLIQDFAINFFWISFKSIGFGFLMGVGSCLLHKYFQGINKMPELEASLIFMMSLLTYGICDLESLKLAAVVAIFIFGIVQSHYNRYNLSHESVEKAGFTFAMVSYICEALIIIYLGLSIDSFQGANDMIWYVLADFIILLFSRFFTIFIMTCIHMLLNHGKLKGLSVTEVTLVAFSGMIRGSLAYALVVKLATHNVDMTNPQNSQKA